MDEEHNNNNNNNNREDAMMEDGDEAFVDLDDPNYEVLEEHEEDEQGSDEDEIDANNNNNNNMQTNNEEEDGGDDASPGAEVEDLNVVPDREPERDDAIAFFVAPDQHPLHSIAVHPNDANLFAVAGEGETIYILRRTPDGANNNSSNNNMSGVVCEHVLTGHTDTISLLSFSPNGAWLASGGLDAHVMLWNTSTWTCTHSLSDLYGEILSLLWHPSSLVLIATADDAQAAMWSVAKGTLAMFFVGHRGPITCVSWTSDNMKLLTGSSDGTVMIFSPKTGEQLVNVAKDLSPDTAGVTAMCFITEDQCVVGCEDGTLHIVSVRAGKVANHLEDIHEQAIEALVMNRVGSLLLSAGCDGKVVLWSTSDLSPRSVLEVGESIITALWLDHRVVAGCGDGVVRVWDGRSSEEEPQSILMGHRRMILRMAPSTTNDGGASVVATASDDGSMRIFAIPSVASA